MTTGRPTLAVVRATLERNRARLLALPNVRFVALGKKVVGDRAQPVLAVRVLVERKERGLRTGRVPARLRAVDPRGRPLDAWVPTDVAEVPRRIEALGTRGGDRVRGTKHGSVAYAYTTRSGVDVLLTNAHVTSGVQARRIGKVLRGTWPAARDEVGAVHRCLRIETAPQIENRIDAALVRATAPFALDVVGRPGTPVRGTGRIDLRWDAGWFYESQGVHKEFVHPNLVPGPVPVTYGAGVVAHFVDVLQFEATGPPPVAGDSGSALCRETASGLVVCGLVFAGGGAFVYVHRIAEVFEALSRREASDTRTAEDVRPSG